MVSYVRPVVSAFVAAMMLLVRYADLWQLQSPRQNQNQKRNADQTDHAAISEREMDIFAE